MSRILVDGAPLVRNASGTVTELVRKAIVEGRIAPGERLKEEELARELGISRTPVREALLVLQAEGLVDAAPNRGATVRSHTTDDLDELYEMRALLEGYAARRAARRITDDQVRSLQASCDRFEALVGGDINDIVAENSFFHGTILDVSGSPRLASMVRGVVELPLVYRSYVYYTPEQTGISLHYHRQLTTALGQRDSERAEILMKEHVFEARDVLVTHLRSAPLPGAGGVA